MIKKYSEVLGMIKKIFRGFENGKKRYSEVLEIVKKYSEVLKMKKINIYSEVLEMKKKI